MDFSKAASVVMLMLLARSRQKRNNQGSGTAGVMNRLCLARLAAILTSRGSPGLPTPQTHQADTEYEAVKKAQPAVLADRPRSARIAAK
jgi:hypothetical protein